MCFSPHSRPKIASCTFIYAPRDKGSSARTLSPNPLVSICLENGLRGDLGLLRPHRQDGLYINDLRGSSCLCCSVEMSHHFVWARSRGSVCARTLTLIGSALSRSFSLHIFSARAHPIFLSTWNTTSFKIPGKQFIVDSAQKSPRGAARGHSNAFWSLSSLGHTKKYTERVHWSLLKNVE